MMFPYLTSQYIGTEEAKTESCPVFRTEPFFIHPSHLPAQGLMKMGGIQSRQHRANASTCPCKPLFQQVLLCTDWICLF